MNRKNRAILRAAVCLIVFAVLFSLCAGGAVSASAVSGNGARLSAAEPRNTSMPFSSFPSSLTVIESEGFEGTALGALMLPDSLRWIGERAFADIGPLRVVVIPASVSFIADNAFEGAERIMIAGEKGSYARIWAAENGFGFINKEALVPAAPSLTELRTRFEPESVVFLLLAALILFLLNGRTEFFRARRRDEGRTLRPQERAELHAIWCRFP